MNETLNIKPNEIALFIDDQSKFAGSARGPMRLNLSELDDELGSNRSLGRVGLLSSEMWDSINGLRIQLPFGVIGKTSDHKQISSIVEIEIVFNESSLAELFVEVDDITDPNEQWVKGIADMYVRCSKKFKKEIAASVKEKFSEISSKDITENSFIGAIKIYPDDFIIQKISILNLDIK